MLTNKIWSSCQSLESSSFVIGNWTHYSLHRSTLSKCEEGSEKKRTNSKNCLKSSLQSLTNFFVLLATSLKNLLCLGKKYPSNRSENVSKEEGRDEVNQYLKPWQELREQLALHPICKYFLPRSEDLSTIGRIHFQELYQKLVDEIHSLAELNDEGANILDFTDPLISIEPFLRIKTIFDKSLDANLMILWSRVVIHLSPQPNLKTANEVRDWLSQERNLATINQIDELSFVKSGLTWIPPELFCFQNLEKLEFLYNQIRVIPIEISLLTRLKTFHLSANKHSVVIPEEIGELQNLIRLSLSSTKIPGLPQQIDNLIQLQFLDLTNCDLEILPSRMGNLSALRELHLGCNPDLLPLPKELTNRVDLKIVS